MGAVGKRRAGAHCVPDGTPAGAKPRRVPAAKPPERAPPGPVYNSAPSRSPPIPANRGAFFPGEPDLLPFVRLPHLHDPTRKLAGSHKKFQGQRR